MLGVAQGLALPAAELGCWAAAMPLLWALGWAVTTLAGIDVEQQFTSSAPSGAVVFAALSGAAAPRSSLPVSRRRRRDPS